MKKILALILSVLMILSLAACTSITENEETDESPKATDTQKTDDNQEKPTEKGEDGGNTNQGEQLPTDENAIFKYVLDALATTAKYNGDITIDTSANNYSNQTMNTQTEERTLIEKELFSYDATNKLRYWETIDDDSKHGKTTSFNKTFVIDNSLYGMEKEINPDSTEAKENYFKIHNASKEEYQTSEQNEVFESILEMYSGFTLAADITEVRAAFDKAIPALFDEMYDVDNAKPSITKEILAESSNGVCTIKVNIDSSLNIEKDGMSLSMFINMHTAISAKDGKIVSFSMELDTEQKATMGEIAVQKYTQKALHSMTVEYKFAKDKYDALVANLPANADDITVVGAPAEDYTDVKTTVYVNGVESETAWYDGVATPQQAFDSIINASRLAMEKVTVKVFKDEAKTQEITRDSITKEEILALDKVYLDVTPIDCALVLVTYSTRYDYSKPYQIVTPFVNMIGFGSSSMRMQPPTCQEAGEYFLESSYVNDDYREIWINGVKQDPKSRDLTLENNKIYVIEYVEVISDSNLAI